ncbi:MAG: hypothetical protein QN173_08905 [Armatimonadota bacterium]|nr:hypothetical protein [Armatimonadota bacterium]MDR7438176.1 hypothetical protein [Armatimonadota bacterium]MDR7472206.1 hypothetical protein [Armatimonadota bacterium]MDR7507706.1 hypothetical protein [Armatimonadota bacterium]MDR7510159.1 hypothetical protein [Armatimonadota bacterium]
MRRRPSRRDAPDGTRTPPAGADAPSTLLTLLRDLLAVRPEVVPPADEEQTRAA